MKNLFLYTLLSLFLACGEKKSNQKMIEVDTMPKEAANKKHVSAARTAEINDELTASVYDQYNRIKTALVNSNAKQAKQVAVELLKSSGPQLESTGLRESLSVLANTSDIEEQRKSFSGFTEVVKRMLTGNITSGKIYYDYCPMAFDGKGAYWLSNEEKIENPYFGEKMLNCGTVEETLN